MFVLATPSRVNTAVFVRAHACLAARERFMLATQYRHTRRAPGNTGVELLSAGFASYLPSTQHLPATV